MRLSLPSHCLHTNGFPLHALLLLLPSVGHAPRTPPHPNAPRCVQAGGDWRARPGHGADQHPQLPAPGRGPGSLQILLRHIRGRPRLGHARLGAHQRQRHGLQRQRRDQAVRHVGRPQILRQPVRIARPRRTELDEAVPLQPDEWQARVLRRFPDTLGKLAAPLVSSSLPEQRFAKSTTTVVLLGMRRALDQLRLQQGWERR